MIAFSCYNAKNFYSVLYFNLEKIIISLNESKE
jgi:hypothetical protein